jgi:hypothetical protein
MATLPEGATIFSDENGGVLLSWCDGDPLVDRAQIMPLSVWIERNCAPGTDADVIRTVSGEIVTVVLNGPAHLEPGPVTSRLFRLIRHEDVSLVSGIGVVAHGVQFPDGACALRWINPGVPPSTAVWDSIEAIELVHGHGGKTEVEWID